MGRLSIAPSMADVWSVCHGWSIMRASQKGELAEDRSSVDEGTTGHKLAELLLKDRSISPGDMIGTVCEETGLVYDDEMWDGAVQYVEYIASVVSEGANWEVEAKLPVPEVHENSNVIIDAYSYDSLSRHLHIFDYKYGYRPVEAPYNLQLVHGTSAVRSLCEREDIAVPETVSFHIVQPRGFHHAGPLRRWDCNFNDLRPTIVKLRVSAQKNFSDRAETKAGPHCSRCPALFNCSTARTACGDAMDFVGRPMPINASLMEDEMEMTLLKRYEKMIKERRTVLEEKVKNSIMRGQQSSMYELKEQLGNRSWVEKPETVIQMGASMGLELKKSETVVTPAEAVRRGLPEDVMEQLVKRPSLGRKLHFINQRDLQEKLKHEPN